MFVRQISTIWHANAWPLGFIEWFFIGKERAVMEKVGMGKVVSKNVRHIRLELSRKTDREDELPNTPDIVKDDKVARRAFGKSVSKLLNPRRNENKTSGEVT
jgi:hypothetical protein